VVAVLGHVDHGKTTLLDAIRETNTAAREHGGITQHIGAYQVTLPLASAQGSESRITFIDTPGHAAFTKMRARGAGITDIALLVVAANDGVMPQTIEAIDHIRAADVPMIVVVNKIDLPDANPTQVYQQLAERDVVVEPYGGQIPAVEVSATQKKGLDGLLEMILLVADLAELYADPEGDFAGVVIESNLEPKRGPLATLLVKNGTLRLRDTVYAGPISGRINAMVSAEGERLKEAFPSTPVEVMGFDRVPEVGMAVTAKAGDLKPESPHFPSPERAKRREDEFLVILRSDVEGTKEAIVDALNKLDTGETHLRILSAATGDISESDIFLARASGAVVFGFNVGLTAQVRKLADAEGVTIKNYKVIYELLEDVETAAGGFGKPEVWILGTGEVVKTFAGTKALIAGVKVTEGVLSVGDVVKVRRGDQVVGEGEIASMRQVKRDVKKTPAGGECGLTLRGEVAFQEGDIVQSYREI
jgi:translation initiation factor IF-2